MNHKLATKLAEKIESFPVDEKPRMHLGASEIGAECVREIWYSFRWVSYNRMTCKSARLLERGDREEEVFKALLTKAGCTVFTKDISTGEQFRILDFNGHFGGSLDGVVSNIVDIPNEWCLAEFKTSGYKDFRILYGYDGKARRYNPLLGKGVKGTHPKHYAQMQIYMHYKGLKYALYCAVNKNDDMLYFEIVSYDPACIPKLQEKAKTAIFSETAPDKITNNPSSFKCLFCNHKGVCQLNETPEINCRTCEHVRMLDEGKWKCGLTDEPKNKKELLNGCEQYKLNGAIA